MKCREQDVKKPLTPERASPAFSWSGLTRRLQARSASSHGSAEQVGTLVFGIIPNKPAKAFFCLPSGWEYGVLGFGFWSPPPTKAHCLALISREAHFQVRISFVQFFFPTGISFFEAHCCMRAGLMLTRQSPLFCLSKSMSKPHDPCIFFYCTY